ncbi:MAG: peptide chain release factor 2 [Bacilli bacterium]|nr:peptide chain release factor 2 [Bacilli bacterium]
MDLLEIKQKFRQLKADFEDILTYFHQDEIEQEINKLSDKMLEANFWNNQREAKKVIDQKNYLTEKLETFQGIKHKVEDIEVGIDLYEDSEDVDLLKDIEKLVKQLEKEINQFEISILLSGPYDQNNAILEIHPGAGGTESQDWAEMLLRMYMRYAERMNFKVEVLDYLAGEEAGIKSVTLLIKGLNAYGYLKSEQGVHRLIRISPFDASGRRHTSFVSVDVIPEFDEDIEVEVKEEDLRIDTFRSSGAGGQHVNTTDSAVRITHLPTGIVVTCQNERSQIANREAAMRMLKAKLYKIELEKQQEELMSLRGEQKEIGWGSQIRTYTFHPYSLVKDHRTNTETGNIQAVMDGEIDDFIFDYLKLQLKK